MDKATQTQFDLHVYALLLEEYIRDLEQELSRESNDNIKRITDDLWKRTGPIPHIPPAPSPWSIKQCSKCGLKLEGSMGYCCPVPECPTGLGSPYCTTVT